MEDTAVTQQERKAAPANPGGGNAVYVIGMIGAWVYYFKRAETNQERVKAFFKGLVWPAFLVYDLMAFLNEE